MRLAEFIQKNMEVILKEWETFARSVEAPGSNMTSAQLRDHAQAMLLVIAADLRTFQSDAESVLKSQGGEPAASEETSAQQHADERRESGFSIQELVSEYRALRASVLRLWLTPARSMTDKEAGDMIRFNEAIDQALAESVNTYAEGVGESQDIFLGILGHDLRSPLQAVSIGAQTLMQSRKMDHASIQLGARMFNSANRMSGMLDDLLDFTRIRIGGGLSIAPAETNLAILSLQIIDELLASNPDRSIDNVVNGNCTGYWDESRIGQVYQNLISNALQYSAAGSPIEIVTQGRSDDVVFTVHNEGMPIPLEAQRHIFDPLRRHTSNTQENTIRAKNLGLGLYIAKEVVTAHSGTITLASTEMEGTTFTVTLPKLRPESTGGLP